MQACSASREGRQRSHFLRMSRQEVRSSAKLFFWSADSMTSLAALVHRSGSFQLCRLLHLQQPHEGL